MVERLKDKSARAEIRRDLLAPGKDSRGEAWDNEWQEITGPEAILVADVKQRALLPIQGKTLAAVAAEWKEDPIDALFDLLVKDNGYTGVSVFGMDEKDVVLALQQPWVSADNDSSGTSPEGILGEEHPHPRAYGTFPRILRKYVREEHALTLPDAIRKFTALPAAQMRIADRGVLKQGMWADLVVFDADRVTDKATYEQPNQYSEGFRDVLVNGVPVIEDSRMTGKLPGKVLRGPGYRP
jgi:dihydroorotase/N-acyl-D-amino-acid deacylase